MDAAIIRGDGVTERMVAESLVLASKVKELEQRCERYRKALETYADHCNWIAFHKGNEHPDVWGTCEDGWKIAAEALEEK